MIAGTWRFIIALRNIAFTMLIFPLLSYFTGGSMTYGFILSALFFLPSLAVQLARESDFRYDRRRAIEYEEERPAREKAERMQRARRKLDRMKWAAENGYKLDKRGELVPLHYRI